ncbi:MAG TPA: hypothetical protein DCY13_18900 [Verrucomicrobiales bacterium]|nr:hypothetical protein [Verrucomicrobiales bacterium]
MSTEISKKIRECRVSAGLSQSQLAARLGYLGDASGLISNLETGVRSPSIELLKAIAKAVGLDDWRVLLCETAPPRARRRSFPIRYVKMIPPGAD